MEAATSVAVAPRGIPIPVSPSRKEWRVIPDHPVQNPGNEDLDRSKLGQGDERLIYEGREPLDLNFFSIAVASGSDPEVCLDEVVKQREQLQHLEVYLKARLMARSEVMKLQERFDSQIKDHITANLKLQDQLHEREKTLQDLQRTLEDKDEELHAIRLDHEAAWAKEDLLREQNKELATFRRERDNSEAERAQHIKKIHDLQEHIQEKDQQLIEMQEQHRAAQETIIYKDEQIREAQAWITRAQEMDVLQMTTNHSLQAELRDRVEQYNQLWFGCQRQFAEMERLHLHALQQIHLELSEAKEKSGTYSDEARATQKILQDTSHFGHSKKSEQEGNGGSSPSDISMALQNGNADIVSSFASTGNALTQTNQIPSAQMAHALHGMSPYLPPGQLAALHPFVMHQQGVPQNMNSHLIQSHVGQFQSVSSPWQNEQATSDGSQLPSQEHHLSQNDQNLLRSETNYDNEVSATGQVARSDYLDAHTSQLTETHSLVPSPNVAGQVHELIDNAYAGETQSQHILQHISLQFQSSLKLNHSDHVNEHREKNAHTVNHGAEAQILNAEKFGPAEAVTAVNMSETVSNKVGGTTISDGFVGIGQGRGKTAEMMSLLDEESLLARVVRTIPPASSGRIRISDTLLNRLNKMLAPLNWADYKRKYGELVDFLAVHPELFFIEGEHIQIREGAQEIIAAMSTHAKVRAAAAAAIPCNRSVLLPSVAVTPMAAQSRLKKASSISNAAVGSLRILSKQNDQAEIAHHLPNGSNGRPVVNTSQSKVIGHIPEKQPARSAGGLQSTRRFK
ncbi:hypothetical protein L1987_75052 [Smallanthus sonchifolius]|uniref:Uncharacterized protein n=1 Tax=Smallanthus sonchifolius TaxID=185202 RepID=A0ACB9A614_9ASTR|nr:hypothetical protein L1987_75052 [Smallanthus sonchifolius]